MIDTVIQNIQFDERGLIAAVLQDAATNEVIALCYIDNETLARNLQSGETSLLSRGEPAGTRPYPLVDVRVNNDGKSLTVLIERETGAGRTRPASLVHEGSQRLKAVPPEVSLVDVGTMEFGITLGELYALIAERNQSRPEGSYTTYLFNSGLDKILKKIAEESGEVIIAAKNNGPGELIAELADVFYHLLVLMVERDVKLSDVGAELTRRAATRSTGPAER
ncbi:MAG TPA: phosphoribosyl-ATP diphosphatase [Blastocatellia bacterium]|nr:phosphoribosyl-ATP diphosphatase [Blastocatellia bacterium]